MIIGDNYKIKDEIGSGTFGMVYKGEHIPTSSNIAIKILDKKKILNNSDLQRVENELKIAQSINFPHLVQLYDILENERYIFLIMEFLEGGELYDHIVTSKRLSEDDAFKYFFQIISAVEYLHSLNIVHRDLKPENLLLDKDKQTVKLVDFGLGRFYNNDSRIETACGSPCYAPPEMLSRQKYEPTKADIWSLGIVLFAMLAGYLPFDEKDTDVLYQKIIEGKFEAPNWIRQETKDFLSLIINVNPEERINFKQMKSTQWFKDHLQNLKDNDKSFCCLTENHSYYNEIDNRVIDELLQKGYDKKKVNDTIKNKIQSEIFCYYHILKKKYGYQIIQKPLQYNFKKQNKPQINFPKYSGPVDLEYVFCKAPLYVYQKLKDFFESNKYEVNQNISKGILKIQHLKKQISFELKVYQFVNFEEGSYIVFDKIKPKKDILKKQLSNTFLKNLKSLFNQQ